MADCYVLQKKKKKSLPHFNTFIKCKDTILHVRFLSWRFFFLSDEHEPSSTYVALPFRESYGNGRNYILTVKKKKQGQDRSRTHLETHLKISLLSVCIYNQHLSIIMCLECWNFLVKLLLHGSKKRRDCVHVSGRFGLREELTAADCSK